MEDDTNASKLHFCSECLTSLKEPTLWCSIACAERNFRDHREKIHLPLRKKLELNMSDEEQLVYDEAESGEQQKPPPPSASSDGAVGGSDEKDFAPAVKSIPYRAKDISSQVIPFDAAVAGWEQQNSVQLGL